jgi:DNA-binding Xre family transcriptional regulator
MGSLYTMKTFSLRRAMQDAGLNCSQLSRKAGISRSTISNLMRGKCDEVREETLRKLSKALGLQPNHLVGYLGKRKLKALFGDDDIKF